MEPVHGPNVLTNTATMVFSDLQTSLSVHHNCTQSALVYTILGLLYTGIVKADPLSAHTTDVPFLNSSSF